MRKALHYIGSFFRGLALVILTSLVSLLVIVGVLLSAITMNVTSADRVKSWVLTPEVYEHGVDAFLAIGDQDFGDEEPAEGGDPFLNEATQDQLLDEFFTFEFYQRAGNEIIDGFYGWLGSETEEPEFNVAIAEDRDELVRLLAIFFASKIEALPQCPPGYVIPEEESILGSHCRPAGFDPSDTEAILAAAAEDEQLNQLLDNTAISSDNIDFSAIDNPDLIQNVFKAAQWLPLLVLSALTLLALLTVLVVYEWRRGLKIISLTMLPLSILLLIAGAVLWWQQGAIVSQLALLASQSDNPAMASLAQEVAGSAIYDIIVTFVLLHLLLAAISTIVLTEPKWQPPLAALWHKHKHKLKRKNKKALET